MEQEPNFLSPSAIDLIGNVDNVITAPMKPTTVLRSKVLVIGDAETGKSSLVRYFLSREFSEEYGITTDVNIVVGGVQIPETNVIVDLFLYEIPGDDMFAEEGALPPGADFVVCCFDVSSRESFDRCSDRIRSARDDGDAEVLLLATKADLREAGGRRVEIDADEGRRYAARHGYKYFECSAKSGSFGSSQSPFDYMANKVYERYVS